MGHVIEPASSGRAKCRGCGERIEKGVLRFGEELENPFADGMMTHWFHLDCAAFKRPEPLLQTLEAREAPLEGREELESEARKGLEHPRTARVDGAERASSGRARCRSCRETIQKDAWRIALVYWEEGRFAPSGFVHAGCAREHFGTADVVARVRRFSPGLGEKELEDLGGDLERGPATRGSGERQGKESE